MSPARGGAALAACLVLAGCSAQPGVVGLPPEHGNGPSMSPEHTRRVVDRLAQDLATLPSSTGAAADARRAEVFSGTALRTVQAQATIGSAGRGASLENPFATSSPLQLQAVSSGAAFPRSLLLLAKADTNELPVLHVAQETDPRAPFRIVASVRLLPGVTVNGFAPTTTGSSFHAPEGLVVAPDRLGAGYAASLRFPRPGPAVKQLAPDSYRASVTRAAAAQAKALAASATYAEAYTPVAGETVAVQQAGGGALVLTALRRTTTITVRPGRKVATPKPFQAFAKGRTALTRQGKVETLVLLAFQVPRYGGVAELVGASEQVLSATGS